MAGRAHVQDNTIVERRLRPIYEWLDGGYNKKALQEADKVLRKTSKLQCARALKSVALLRLGRDAEAIAILDGLIEEKPYDDATLQAMTICYRELHQYSKVCTLYEIAVKEDPANEELRTHLFMSYVTTLDFQQQQQSAMALYKIKPKNPYYFWAVMSVVLRANRDSTIDTQNRNLLLSLAERMVVKLLNENRIEVEQELQLYLLILKLQNKNEEALKLLDNPLGSRLLTNASTYAKIPFLINLKQWKQLNALTTKMLYENMDAWDIWQYYLQSVFELMHIKKSEQPLENSIGDTMSVDDSPEKCHDFICTLMELSTNNGRKQMISPMVRGPWLARLELYNMMEKHNCDPKELLGDYLELLVEYFTKFGHKPCCIYDIKLYLKKLPLERHLELATKLNKVVGVNLTELPQNEIQMQQHITSLLISRLCGAHEDLSDSSLMALVTTMTQHYHHGYKAYGKKLNPTEPDSAEMYLIVSTHLLYDLAVREKSSTAIILALSLLENLLKIRPNNHHAKLLTLRLYHCLGAGLAAHNVYDLLNIKHVQLDSMAHVHCTQSTINGPFSVNSLICQATCMMFNINHKDMADHLTFSYKYGSFLKVEELLDFRDRLHSSIHRYWCFIEKAFLDLVQCNDLNLAVRMEAIVNFTESDFDKISDNRDLSAYINYDPITLTDQITQNDKEIFEQDKQVIRLRTALYHYVMTALKVSLEKDEARKKLVDELIVCKENYVKVRQEIENKKYQPIIMNRITSHFPSRLHKQLSQPYQETFDAFIAIILQLVNPNDNDCLKQIEITGEKFKAVCQRLCDDITENFESTDYHFHKRHTVENVLNYIEIISLSSLLCVACCEIAKPMGVKKRKQKNSTNPLAVSLTHLKSLVSTMKEQIEMVEKSINKWWNPDKAWPSFIERLRTLSLSDGIEDTICIKLLFSHTALVKELNELLKAKLKMLNSANHDS